VICKIFTKHPGCENIALRYTVAVFTFAAYTIKAQIVAFYFKPVKLCECFYIGEAAVYVKNLFAILANEVVMVMAIVVIMI